MTLYGELRKFAAARMAGEYGPQTLQATALVHEAWLRLGGDEQPEWNDRTHLFAAVAEAMRHILVDRARRRRRLPPWRRSAADRPGSLELGTSWNHPDRSS